MCEWFGWFGRLETFSAKRLDTLPRCSLPAKNHQLADHPKSQTLHPWRRTGRSTHVAQPIVVDFLDRCFYLTRRKRYSPWRQVATPIQAPSQTGRLQTPLGCLAFRT